MISNPNSIFYACIANKTTILAEFNTHDADLAILALKCLENAPPLHTSFSHTIRNKTYTFLIEEPFVYFSISDEALENPEVLFFLKSVKEAFDQIVGHVTDLGFVENLSSHCFQGEFNPIFHQLLAPHAVDLEGPNSRREVLYRERSGSLDSPRGKRIGSVPLLGGGGDSAISLKKKKKRRNNVNDGEFNGEEKDGFGENKVDVFDDGGGGGVLSRDFSVSMAKSSGLFAGDLGQQKAKKVWKKHVWVVLSFDLIVCTILFGVWLWVCRGFKCIDG